MTRRLFGYMSSVLFCTAAFCAPNPPELIVHRTASPLEILTVERDSIEGGLGEAKLVFNAVSKQRILNASVNVSYWIDDLPLGGHVVQVTENQIYEASSIPVKLSSFAKSANKILFSVVSASSANSSWKVKHSLGIPLLEQAKWNLSSRFGEADWQARKDDLTTNSSSCSTSLAQCGVSAVGTCGSGNVGGVIFVESTCACCYYCKGSAPPSNCGGSGGNQ